MTDNGRRMTTIKRVLVANRGEIALRIIRACHEEGLEAVAVYSEADRLSPHVRAADLAVPLGPPAAAQSYLDITKLIAAAQGAACQAVHPGYGFLSERAPFAEAVAAASLEFIGPPAAAIRAMGDKTEARRRMQQAGVPIVPGTTRPLADHVQARPEAARLGYPVLLKAAAGGGGKGMRLVREEAELEAGFEAAAGGAPKTVGGGGGDLGKDLERPRPIEIHNLAGSFGRGVAVGGRRGIPGGGHDRISARAEWRVLLPGDEHATPGRAPGDRARLRSRHRARAAARGHGPAVARARGHAAAAGPCHRVSHHGRGPVQRLPSGDGRRALPGDSRWPRSSVGRRDRSGQRGHAVLRPADREADRVGRDARRRPRADATRAARAGDRRHPVVPGVSPPGDA